MIYWDLLIGFLKVGLFAFGGAYGAIPLIRDVVLAYGWLDDEMLTYMIAVSESTPGPIMVNLAAYVGSAKAGLPGALIATAAVVLPSFDRPGPGYVRGHHDSGALRDLLRIEKGPEKRDLPHWTDRHLGHNGNADLRPVKKAESHGTPPRKNAPPAFCRGCVFLSSGVLFIPLVGSAPRAGDGRQLPMEHRARVVERIRAGGEQHQSVVGSHTDTRSIIRQAFGKSYILGLSFAARDVGCIYAAV